MADPFIDAQPAMLLEQELQRLQQENKKLREANAKLQGQLNYVSTQVGGRGGGARRGSPAASLRSLGSQRSTGSRVSQLRRVASVGALQSKSFAMRESTTSSAPAAYHEGPGAGLVSSPTSPSPVLSVTRPRALARGATTHERLHPGRSGDAAEGSARGEGEGDRPSASPRGSTSEPQRRVTEAEADAAQARSDAKRQDHTAQKEIQRVRSRFESFVTYTCEREESYNTIYTQIHAELAEAQARCAQLEAEAQAARDALVALQAQVPAATPQAPPRTRRARGGPAMTEAPPHVLAACETLTQLLHAPTADGDSAEAPPDLAAVRAPLAVLTEFLRDHTASAQPRRATKRPRGAAAEEAGSATEEREEAASQATTTTTPHHTIDEESVPEAPLSGPGQLRLARGGASLRDTAERRQALQLGTAKKKKTPSVRSEATHTPKRPRQKRTAAPDAATLAADAEARAFALSQFPSGQDAHGGVPSSSSAKLASSSPTFAVDPANPVSSFLDAYGRHTDASGQTVVRDTLRRWFESEATGATLAEEAVRHLCRARPDRGPLAGGAPNSRRGDTQLSSRDLDVLALHVGSDLAALCSVGPGIQSDVQTGLVRHLRQLITVPWHGAEEREAQQSVVQVTAVSLRRAVFMEFDAHRRGVRGADVLPNSFVAATDHMLDIVFDLTLAFLRAWRGDATSGEEDTNDETESPSAHAGKKGSHTAARKDGSVRGQHAADESAGHVRTEENGADTDDAGFFSELVGAVPRRVRLADRWLWAIEALCTRTTPEQHAAQAVQAPPEVLPRRRLTYMIQALFSACLTTAVAEAQTQSKDGGAEAVAQYWERRWHRFCDRLGWSVRQLPLEALARAALTAVCEGVRSGFDATRSVDYRDAIASVRLVVVFHGFAFVQTVKDHLSQAFEGEANTEMMTEPFAQWMGYAVLDLGLHDPRDELWGSTVRFFTHYLSSVSADACCSAEEMTARLRPTHILVARALLQLCSGAELSDVEEESVKAAATLRDTVEWVLSHRAAVVVAEARQQRDPGGVRRHPLLDSALGQHVLRICSDPLATSEAP